MSATPPSHVCASCGAASRTRSVLVDCTKCKLKIHTKCATRYSNTRAASSTAAYICQACAAKEAKKRESNNISRSEREASSHAHTRTASTPLSAGRLLPPPSRSQAVARASPLAPPLPPAQQESGGRSLSPEVGTASEERSDVDAADRCAAGSRACGASIPAARDIQKTKSGKKKKTDEQNRAAISGDELSISKSNFNSVGGSMTNGPAALNIDTPHLALSGFEDSILSRLELLLQPLNTMPAIERQLKQSNDRLLELETIIIGQNSQLVELCSQQRELIEENLQLKNKIIKIEKNMSLANNNFDNFDTFARQKLSIIDTFLTEQLDIIQNNFEHYESKLEVMEHTVTDPLSLASNTGKTKKRKNRKSKGEARNRIDDDLAALGSASIGGGDGAGRGELVVSCAVDSTAYDIAHEDFVLAALGAVLPPLARSDIRSVRQIAKKSPAEGGGDSTGGVSALLVSLSRGDLVADILKNRSKHTSFSTKNIDTSRLGVESTLPAASIFINEYLNRDTYKNFLNIKNLAKSLGFKYVWHRKGRFLVRLREGCTAYSVTSPADLYNLMASLKDKEDAVSGKSNSTTPEEHIAAMPVSTADAKEKKADKPRNKKRVANEKKD